MRPIKMIQKMLLLTGFLTLLISACKEDEILPNPPVISGIEAEYTIIEGETLLLKPTVENSENATYRWLLDGEEVGNRSEYTFLASGTGEYIVVLTVTNKGGTDEKRATITVEAQTQGLKTSVYTILPLELSAYKTVPENLKLTVTQSPSELYKVSMSEGKKVLFVAATVGTYTLELSAGEVVFETIQIEVEETPSKLSPYIAKVFDYMPAPGQFVNKFPDYAEGDTHQDMVRKAGEWLIGEDAFMITLGGWGGYVIFGFDHTIVNVKGKRDFRIRGNASGSNDNKRPGAPFGGSCEPGIIMVAYDKNKNGKPDDDEWYEIKGSGNFSAKDEPWYTIAEEVGNDVNVHRDYEMTYYRPVREEPETNAEPDNPEAFTTIKNYIRWEDNKNNSGYKTKNVYHKQSYYPRWIKEDKMTFKGIRLAENGVDESKFDPDISAGGVYFVLYGYQYGYVDNKPNMDDDSAIDIDWAIDKNGNPANLPGIDFVKVYNGVNQECGWIGETSTEVERGEDLHMLGIGIETIK